MQQVLMRENKLGRAQEHFWVVGLNNANKILFIELIGLGRQNGVHDNPPDVFCMTIYKLAVRLIMVHNHPSGNLTASVEDKAITDRVFKVGAIISIDVLDHIIISETSHASFAEMGIMAQIKKSDTWRLIDRDQYEIKQLKREIEIEKAEKKGKLEVAKKRKDDGMELSVIKHFTGLMLPEIKKL